jgi:hypothetical protein
LTYVLSGATTRNSAPGGINYADGETYNVGITSVTYTVTDVNGLTASCTHTVWIRNLNAPQFSSTCPADVTVSAAGGQCSATVSVPAPVINNPCNEVYSVVNSFNGTADASGVYLVGVTTVVWTITDASLNVKTCTQVVTVTDLMPTLACPPNVVDQALFELDYKDNIGNLAPLSYGDNCPDPQLTWSLVPPINFASEYDVTELSGTGPYPSPNTFYVGVTSITYTVTDSNANSVSCTFTVTILAKPEITCHVDISGNTDTGTCTYNVNPGVPTLDSGVQPITWDWRIDGPDGSTVSGTFLGSTSNPGPPDIGARNFVVGTSTITWRATNISGYDECTQLVVVEDKEPPTFTPVTITRCVDLLVSASYTATNPNPNSGINPNLIINPSPDYYTFKAGDVGLDLTVLDDNCCGTASLTVNWRIEFAPVPDPLNPTGPAIINANIAGTGQPSEYVDPLSGLPADIYLWGDGVTFTTVTHSIFYWVEDCHGNKSDEQREEINITPRPQIIKMN